MAKLKYRKGSEIFEIFDTDDIKALQTKVDEVPRLPTFGSTSGNWPFGVVYWNVSADKKRLSLHGNIYFDSCGDAWSAMKAIPGGASNEWGLQVATPLGAQSKALWIPAVGFSTTNSTIEAKMTAVETKLTVKSDGLWRYLVLGSFVIGWRTDRFVVPQWNSWGNLWESSAKLSSVIYPGGYQGKFSQVALFCNAKNVGEVTSCGVEFEDGSTPDVLNKFPNVYLLRPNNAGTNVTYDVYRMFIGQLK